MHHWLGAIEIFKDNPVIGVGYGNYGYHFQDYQYKVPARFFAQIWLSIRDPHSTVFGVLSELGIVGLLLMVGVLTFALRNLKGVWSSPNRRPLWIGQALSLALVTYAVFSFGATTEEHKLLWLLFGLTEVFRQLTINANRLSPRPDGDLLRTS